MKKNFWQLIKVAPALVGASLLAVSPAQANDAEVINQLDAYSAEGYVSAQDQVTSVSQLSDVSPTDWAYEALRSLVERYGCIVGYPDRTFRGNRALSRYEFAAGLNACMQQMERLIAASEAVLREDIEKLQRLMKEFEAELAALGARVDNLEGRVAFLEDHQFSTTTKLQGEVILALTDEFTSNLGGNQTVLQDRVRLALNTSFTGKDTLVTRLAAGNATRFKTGFTDPSSGLPTRVGNGRFSPTTTQTFNLGETGNDVIVDWIAYYTPVEFVGSTLNVYVAGTGGIHSDYVNTLNPYFEDYDGGNGALSAFASENPIYRIGSGAGAAATYEFDFLEGSAFTVGYLAANGDDPTDGNGLFNGDYALLAQLNADVTESISLGFTYVNSYNSGASGNGLFGNLVGTTAANTPGISKEAHSFGFSGSWRATDRISLSAFFSYSDVDFTNRPFRDDEVFSYGGGIAFPDLGKEGNLLGIFAGVQPYSDNLDSRRGTELPIHVEAFYKYQINDNISITPGLIWVSNPEQTNRIDDALIGTIRTTFTF